MSENLRMSKGMQRFALKVFERPVEISKREPGDEKIGESKQLPEDDPFSSLIRLGLLIEPPFDMFSLSTMPEMSTELEPCIDTMTQNIDGFGHRLVPRIDIARPDVPKELLEKVRLERTRLQNFFLYAGGPTDSFRALRMKTRHDLETTGNGYWEVIRNDRQEISYFMHIKAYQVRLTPVEQEAIRVDMPHYEIQVDGSLEIKPLPMMRRFRKYVQRNTTVGTGGITTGIKARWFKEFGDPRVYDYETGRMIEGKEAETYPLEKRANEIVHFKLYSTRSPYGLPRYVGCLVDIFGDRKASEINYVTFCNNNVPSMMVLVSNGMLTQDSVDRIKEMFESLQGHDNRSKILVLESEPVGVEGEEMGQAKLDIKPLQETQQSDALFQNYSKENQVKVRVAFRLPPIFLGRSQDYNRATADTARRLADEQVFAPARDEFDDFMNRILFPYLGAIYLQYKSNSPNTTDNAELVNILGGSEKTGGMTPRIARQVLEQILGTELPPFKEGFDPDIPFSLTMAEAVKNMGDASEPGQTVTALKRIQTIDMLTGGKVGTDVVKALLVLKGQLEEEWNRSVRVDNDHGEEIS